MKFTELIQTELFKKIEEHGEIFFVGGCVRDYYLGLQPKDIDIIVRCLPLDYLKDILNDFGKVDVVGESFGVIKFKHNDGWELDIALPRRDSAGEGKGHTSIIAQSDPHLPIEEDLKRRDFTINAIALDTKMRIVDPFLGLRDLYMKTIKCVDEAAFVEDPLRIARGIQFALRFKFSIDFDTLQLIKKHKEKLWEIAPERKLMELDKIANKGVCSDDLEKLLQDTECCSELFGFPFKSFPDTITFKSVSEILFFVSWNYALNPKEIIAHFVKQFTITVKTQKELDAFLFVNRTEWNGLYEARKMIFAALQITKSIEILDSEYFDDFNAVEDFKSGKIPASIHQLKLNGDELMEQGFFGKQIGDVQKKILDEIFSDRLTNNSWEITKFVHSLQKI